MRRLASALVLCAIGLCFQQPSTAQAQEDGQTAKVFKSITTSRLEGLLKGMKIEYKKSASPKSTGTFFYDYANRDNFRIRLSIDNKGKFLWVDAPFKAISLEAINDWNRKAKFGRAVLSKQKSGKSNAIIEWQLDLLGGSTEAIIRQYLRQFDNEVRRFSKHVADSNKSF